MSLNYYTVAYGFGSATAVLSFSAMVSAFVGALRNRQCYGLYLLLFLAGTFSFVWAILYIVAALNEASGYPREMFSASVASAYLYGTFVPLLFSVFFEGCRTIIVKTPPIAGQAPSKAYYVRKLYFTYAAYSWTVILFITNIASCALYNIDVDTSNYYSWVRTLNRLYSFNTYGIWAYVLFGIGQLITGSQELRSCMRSLTVYFLFALVANIGLTITSAVPSLRASGVASIIISFVMVELIGPLGLWFALWFAPRSWAPKPQVPVINQPYYGFYAPGPVSGAPSAAPQPPLPQNVTNPAEYSPQIQQQYPVVQIPQQQLQSGQYPIVQIPISHQQQGGQYPVIQVQPIVQQYPAGQYTGQQ